MYLVCGEALFDVFASPTALGNRLTLEAVAGGSPFNVAVGLRRLGVPAALFTGLSRDYFGQRLGTLLATEGVDTGYLVDVDAPTTLAMVALDATGAPVYDFRGAGCADRLPRIDQLPPLGDDVRGVHLGSYSLVVEPIADTLQALVERAEGRLISLDPNIRLNVEPSLERWRERIDRLVPRVQLIKASDEDLRLLYPDQSQDAVVQRWLAQGCRVVLLTRGGDGASLYRDGTVLSAAAPAITVCDSVGAGDTFQAGVLAWLHEQGADSPAGLEALADDALQRMLDFACRAAAITCTRRGPDLPRRAELD
ncbi:carbohydrate kinase [Stutzerimonas urumqiensis]|uniref:carbohydrate kinase family protein n=1 Tax=Stutzerimonas urumqiensis TaxID=638269 RepID=UPI003DA22D9A